MTATGGCKGAFICNIWLIRSVGFSDICCNDHVPDVQVSLDIGTLSNNIWLIGSFGSSDIYCNDHVPGVQVSVDISVLIGEFAWLRANYTCTSTLLLTTGSLCTGASAQNSITIDNQIKNAAICNNFCWQLCFVWWEVIKHQRCTEPASVIVNLQGR